MLFLDFGLIFLSPKVMTMIKMQKIKEVIRFHTAGNQL